MITLILKIIFLTVEWSLGWKIAVSDGMIFQRIGRWAQDKIKQEKFIGDVLFCEWCIPNIQGLIIVWPLCFGLGVLPFEWNIKYLLMYPFCVGASSFITGILWTIYLTINNIKDHFQSTEE